MTRLRRLSFLVLLIATSIAVPAFAQPRSPTVVTEDQKKAQEHFQKARDLYSQGSYRDALSELEVARNLDPKAKDLVMNLGIVNEKLAKYDDAIRWFKTFLEMEDVTAAEKTRAEGFIRRIEGAKKEAAARNPPPSPPASTTAPPPSASTSAPPPPATTEAPRGRVDGATIGAGVVAGLGFAAGATFGAFALGKRPTNFITGRDGSYADLQSQTDSAHTMAIVADVGIGVGVVATIVALYLYFGRTKDASARALPGGFTF